MKRSEYERLKKQIEDEYRRKLDALETVWKMVAAESAPDADSGSSHFAKLINDLIDSLPNTFTVREVEARLAASSSVPVNRSTVSHTLKRMSVDQSKIRVSYAGAGKRPTLYEKVAPVGAVQSQLEAVIDEIKELVQGHRISIPRFKSEILRGRYGVDFVRDLNDEQVAELRGQLTSGALASLSEQEQHAASDG